MTARPSPLACPAPRPRPRFGRTPVGVLAVCALALALAACAVDPARLPRTWLLQARQAVAARNAPAALAALDHAEALWTSANTPFSTPFFGFDPEALRDMGAARVAVRMGRWGDAAYYIRIAIAQPTVVNPGRLPSPGP